MKKIYLIEASFGSYDDYHTRVVKAFSNRVKAEVYSLKFEKVMKRVSEHLSEYKTIEKETLELLDESNDDFQKAFENTYKKIHDSFEYKLAFERSYTHQSFESFNWVKIVKMEVF